jgi:hypothetical protein
MYPVIVSALSMVKIPDRTIAPASRTTNGQKKRGGYPQAGRDCNVVNNFIEPELEFCLPITDMLLQGFLFRRTRICTRLASKSHWLSNNQ